MSGETERNISAWTNDTVLLHLGTLIDANDLRYQQRFDAQQLALRDALLSQEKAVNAALTAAQQAVQKAEIAAEKRFDAVNEFRAQLADQAATLMPRTETQVILDAIGQRITSLERSANRSGGRSAAISDSWGAIGIVLGLLIGIAGIVLGSR